MMRTEPERRGWGWRDRTKLEGPLVNWVHEARGGEEGVREGSWERLGTAAEGRVRGYWDKRGVPA